MKRRGFSLLETILATALLSGVVLLLFNLYPAAAMAVRNCQDQLEADSIAQSILDEYSAGPFSALIPGNLTRPPEVRGGTSYLPLVEVFPVGSDPSLLCGVRVTVSYPSVRGQKSEMRELYLVNLRR